MSFGHQPARRRPELRQTQLELGRRHRPDHWLLIWCVVLMVIGLMVVYAISPALAAAHHVSNNYYVNKQLLAIGLSFIAFAITSQVPLSWWRQAYKPLLVIAALTTVLALIMPVNPAYPAHRWVRLGGLSFQSVELVKFALMIWLAGFLAKQIRVGEITNSAKTLKPILLALGAVSVIVMGVQSDFGSTVVIIAMLGLMAFIGGLPLGRIALVAAVVSACLVLAISATPYRRARLEAFIHPQANCQSSGYQACQALIAVGSGGMIGLGLGSSVQAYGYLPEAANDSIFAIYAEKFGFIGSIVLLAVYIAFFSRLKNISERSSDDFSRLMVGGMLAWLSVQTLINVGAMIGLLPLKGITLPFISYGGTSVIFAAAAVGLAYQSSRYTLLRAPGVRVPNSHMERNFRDNTIRRANY